LLSKPAWIKSACAIPDFFKARLEIAIIEERDLNRGFTR
jgi:hypothetical protein